MELSKYRNFLKDDNYVHCSICANYRNINSFAHRKSKDHQKKVALKLRKIAFHLSQKKKKPVVIHDEQWPERDCKRFCHFCSESYAEHSHDEGFIVENLGSMYHHVNSLHAESVKAFLKRNFCDNKVEKYFIQKTDLDRFLEKVSEAKEKYLKKMDILNNMILKQIKDSEEERQKLNHETQVELYNTKDNESHHSSQANITMTEKCSITENNSGKAKHLLYNSKKKSDFKVPPWLEDVAEDSSVFGNSSTDPVIGPTMGTLLKHEANQRKKGLSKNRVGANFDRKNKGSSKWLPSFQGVWNQGRRKQLEIQFKRKNPKFKF